MCVKRPSTPRLNRYRRSIVLDMDSTPADACRFPKSTLPQDLTASEMVQSLVACFERDEEIWNAYKDILRPTAQEMGMPDSFLDNLKPADIYPTLLGEFEVHTETRSPYVSLLADCEARSAIVASPTVANPTPNIAQTVAAAIAAASPTATPAYTPFPTLAVTSTETPRPTSMDQAHIDSSHTVSDDHSCFSSSSDHPSKT